MIIALSNIKRWWCMFSITTLERQARNVELIMQFIQQMRVEQETTPTNMLGQISSICFVYSQLFASSAFTERPRFTLLSYLSTQDWTLLRAHILYCVSSFQIAFAPTARVGKKDESDQQTHQVKAFETRQLGCMNCHRWIAWLACPFVCDWNAGKTARFPGSDSTCASFQNFFVDTLRRTAMQAGISSEGVLILPRISILQKNSQMTAKWIRPQMLCKCPASEIFKDTFGSILNQHAQSVVKSDINQHGPTAPAWAVQCAAGRGHGSPVSESVTHAKSPCSLDSQVKKTIENSCYLMLLASLRTTAVSMTCTVQPELIY